MKLNIQTLLIWCLLNILAIPQLFAQDIIIIPNTFVSYRDFEYSVANGGVDGTIKSVGLGITGIYDRFYINLSGERTPSASEEATKNLFSPKVDFERTDFAASFGYAVTDSISTFLGYKYGKTTIAELSSSSFAGLKTSLEGKGLYAGIGGGWQVKEWGTFSFSAAYALMDATYRDLFFDIAQGDASGTSLGIKWKAPLTEKLFYDVSLMQHNYYYKNFDKSESDISEQILSIRLGLSYQF